MGDFSFFEYPNPFIWWQVLLYLVAVAWGSFIIGCFGVGGGAIFVPCMLMLPGMNPKLAVGTVFVGVAPSSLCRFVQLHRYGRLNIRAAVPLMVGASGGALVGQAVLQFVPVFAVSFFVAGLSMFAGFKIQLRAFQDRRLRLQKQAAQAAIGAAGDQLDAEASGAPWSGKAPPVTGDGEGSESLPLSAPLRPKAKSTGRADGMSNDFCLPMCSGLPWSRRQAPLEYQCAGPIGRARPVLPEAPLKAFAPVLPRESKVVVAKEVETPGDATMTSASPGSPSAVHQQRKEALVKAFVGFFAALFSSVSGTGGPIIMFPLFLLWDPNMPMKTLIGLSSPFGCTTVCFSAIGALIIGQVDLGFALLFSIVSTTGFLSGGYMMERLGDSSMKLTVGVVLIGIGLLTAVRTSIQVAA